MNLYLFLTLTFPPLNYSAMLNATAWSAVVTTLLVNVAKSRNNMNADVN